VVGGATVGGRGWVEAASAVTEDEWRGPLNVVTPRLFWWNADRTNALYMTPQKLSESQIFGYIYRVATTYSLTSFHSKPATRAQAASTSGYDISSAPVLIRAAGNVRDAATSFRPQ